MKAEKSGTLLALLVALCAAWTSVAEADNSPSQECWAELQQLEAQFQAQLELLTDVAPGVVRGGVGGMAVASAVEHGLCEAAVALLDAGADAQTPSEGGALPPLQVAASKGLVPCVGALRTHGAGALAGAHWEEALLQAARADRYTEVAGLLAAGVNPNAKATDGNTALSLASKEGHALTVIELLKWGANTEIQISSSYNRTALIIASAAGQLDVVLALLEAGANKEARDTAYGDTAFSMAAYKNHASVVRALIAAGADVNSGRYDGITPLMWSAKLGFEEMVQLLLKAGVNMNARNTYDNKTALAWATENGQPEIANTLKAAGAV